MYTVKKWMHVYMDAMDVVCTSTFLHKYIGVYAQIALVCMHKYVAPPPGGHLVDSLPPDI